MEDLEDEAEEGTASILGIRWPRWLFVALALAGATVAFFVWRTGTLSTRYAFEPETVSILRRLSQENPAVVYEAASFQFRERHLPDTFADLIRRMNATLGPFEKVRRVKRVVGVDTIGGRAVRVDYALKFANGNTNAEMSYIKESDGQWRLLGFEISIPDELMAKAKKLAEEDERIKAPKEVILLLNEIMAAIGRGEGARVRREASPPFQESASEAAFLALLATHESELGEFLRVVTILDSGQNSDMTQASVDALLEYRLHKTPGSFDFIKVDGKWKLLRLKIEIPEPLLPKRGNPIP